MPFVNMRKEDNMEDINNATPVATRPLTEEELAILAAKPEDKMFVSVDEVEPSADELVH